MKGVIASIARAANVIDITHGIAPQAIAAGALVLAQSWGYFRPARSSWPSSIRRRHRPSPDRDRNDRRRAFIGPDNGLLSSAANQAGLRRVVELKTARYRLPAVSATFHGRDIFAPAAAHLWRGVRMAALGLPLPAITPAPVGRSSPRPVTNLPDRSFTLMGSAIWYQYRSQLLRTLRQPLPWITAFR